MSGIDVEVKIGFALETCPAYGCGIMHAVPHDFQQRRQKDHKTFYCPNGHPSSYSGETAEQKRIKELENEKIRLQQRVEAERAYGQRESARREQAQRSLAATKGVLTRTKKRIAKGKCPCCDLLFVDVRGHMSRKHPDYAAVKGDE